MNFMQILLSFYGFYLSLQLLIKLRACMKNYLKYSFMADIDRPVRINWNALAACYNDRRTYDEACRFAE